jgi:ubiquitin carboxyl-terminal hydrolase 7
MKGKNLEKVKFAVVKRSSYSKPIYLNDSRCSINLPFCTVVLTRSDDVLWDVASQDDDLLGLDHVDRTRAVRNGTQDLFLR